MGSIASLTPHNNPQSLILSSAPELDEATTIHTNNSSDTLEDLGLLSDTGLIEIINSTSSGFLLDSFPPGVWSI